MFHEKFFLIFIKLLQLCFKVFLEKVVEESKEFIDIDEIIKRYENLTNIRKELEQKHEKKIADLKRLTADVFKRSKVNIRVSLWL